eukprot:1303966-Alexandrium_andersonii.AAC.1
MDGPEWCPDGRGLPTDGPQRVPDTRWTLYVQGDPVRNTTRYPCIEAPPVCSSCSASLFGRAEPLAATGSPFSPPSDHCHSMPQRSTRPMSRGHELHLTARQPAPICHPHLVDAVHTVALLGRARQT